MKINWIPVKVIMYAIGLSKKGSFVEGNEIKKHGANRILNLLK